MNEIIKIEEIEGEPRVDSRTIAEELGVDHPSTIRMIKKFQDKLEAYGRVGFQIVPLQTAGGVQNTTICYLNERQATFLVTLSKNSEKAVDLKQKLTDSYYYYKQKNAPQIPPTYSEALQLAADQARKLEEAQPKIEYYDKVADAQGLHTVSEAAKLLGTGRNKLFTWLRESGYLMQNNEPYQKYIDVGYFEIRETVHENIISVQTFLTPKGLQKIAKKHGVRKEKAEEPQISF